MQSEKRKIRALVVDDSAVMRRLISNVLDRDNEIEVVATAIDGCFALAKVEQLKPDVVTLDVDMPRMDGLTALGEMVARHGTRVVMLSSLTSRGAALTMQALEKGAVDFVCKPAGVGQIEQMAGELISKVKAAARTRPVAFEPETLKPPPKKRPGQGRKTDRIVAIGASSGGPHALRYLLPRLPADLDAGILIVQHMPESFTTMLAYWLNQICELEVKEAEAGELAVPGKVLIAPGNAHMKVRKAPAGCEVLLDAGALVNGHRPSVDVLFDSVAQHYGPTATGVVLTGMGNDGAHGLGLLRQAGARTIAQDEESSAVYGMPRIAAEKGFAEKVLPLNMMPSYLISAVGRIAQSESVCTQTTT
jgi:two-component system chemotaxis response regulator CheB